MSEQGIDPEALKNAAETMRVVRLDEQPSVVLDPRLPVDESQSLLDLIVETGELQSALTKIRQDREAPGHSISDAAQRFRAAETALMTTVSDLVAGISERQTKGS